MKTLLWLCRHAGWFESSLGAHVRRYVSSHYGSIHVVFIRTVSSGVLQLLQLVIIGNYTFSVETTVTKSFCPLLKRGLLNKERTWSLYRRVLACIKANKNTRKLYLFVEMARNLPSISSPFNQSMPLFRLRKVKMLLHNIRNRENSIPAHSVLRWARFLTLWLFSLKNFSRFQEMTAEIDSVLF